MLGLTKKDVRLPEQDKRYGKVIERAPIDNGEQTLCISVIEKNGERFLDIRSIYFRDNEPQFGKGVRIRQGNIEETLMYGAAFAQEHGLLDN